MFTPLAHAGYVKYCAGAVRALYVMVAQAWRQNRGVGGMVPPREQEELLCFLTRYAHCVMSECTWRLVLPHE